MIKCLAVLCGLLASAPALADSWNVNPEFRDARTKDDVVAAVASNQAGYAIAIFRNQDKRVRMVLELPKNSFDRLATSGRIAAIRPDQKTVRFIENAPPMANLEKPYLHNESVTSLIWHGSDPAPLTGTLRDILDASKLTVRFFTDTGTTVDTEFDLASAAPAIAKALGIPATLDADVSKNATTAAQLVVEASQRCYHPSVPSASASACMSSVVACAGKDQSKVDIPVFKACLAKINWPSR